MCYRPKIVTVGVAWLAVATSATAQTPTPFVLEPDAAYTVAFGDQFYGAVTAGPGEYFAVWVDLRTGGANPAGYDLYGQRIRPDGTVAAPGSIELLREPGRTTSGIPAVAWNGTVYLVAWYEGATLFGMRVDANGEVLDPGGFVIGTNSGSLRWPAVAGDGQDFLVVQASGSSVVAHSVSGGGVVNPSPIVISSGASQLGYPKVTFGAGVYNVVWSQSPSQAIRAARVTPAGNVLDPGGINVSGGGTDVDAHVDFDGVNFYVVWQRRDGGAWDLWGAHVSPQAQVVSGPTRLLDGNTWGAVSSGQVAFNGTNHLITITTNEPAFSNSDLYALMVDGRSGRPIGAPFPVSTLSQRSQVAFGVASVGDQFFMLWEANYVRGVQFVYDTEGARVDAGGRVLDRPTPIAVSTCASWQIASAVSFDGENFLCVFEDWREGKPSYQSDLYGVRVTPEGQVLDSSAFRVAGGFRRPQGNPDATFGGGQHVVVYENENAASINEVRMVRVLPDGTVLDPDGILIFANEPTAETFYPKVAWNGEKYCIVWYDSYLLPGQELLQFALVRVDGTIEHGPVNVPNSDDASFDGFELGSNGDEFLLAWVGYDSVKSTRIDTAGNVLGTRIVQNTGEWITEYPTVAFNGESYLVAWSKWGNGGVSVQARRVSQSGMAVGNLINVTGPDRRASAFDIFAVGTDFDVIGWRQVGNEFELFDMRIDAAGTPYGEPEVLTILPRDETYAGSSCGMTPAGVLLTAHSLWASDPYNTPRAQGQLFRLGAVPGDMNCDGVLNGGDIDPFFLALGDPPAYAARFPNCDPLNGDINRDGRLDGGDIDAFFACLGGTCP